MEYQRGQFAAAAQDLRIAAFGLVDTIPDYETAQVYALLANEKLGRRNEAAAAAEKILQADGIQRSYATLPLDASIRSEFETALRSLVTPERLTKSGFFAPRAATAPQPAPVPRAPLSVTPQPLPPPAPRQLTAAERAAAAWQAGDYATAQQLAQSAVADDYVNALAQTVLARLGWRANDWNAVVDHYGVVRTRRRLTNEENAEFYVAMLRSGRSADAEGVRRVLPRAVLTMPVVTQTITAMQPAPPPPPAPRVVTPQPQPPPPQPRPQPQAPAPQPAAPSVVMPPAVQPSQGFAQQAPAPSPLVAIARRQPSEAAAVHNVASALVDADRLLREGRIASAREAYLRLTLEPAVSRDLSLEIAKGLNRTSAWRASSLQYQKLYPLKHGEEMHMLYEAENRYELGDLETARQIFSVALPGLPKSQEVELYRGKIQGRR